MPTMPSSGALNMGATTTPVSVNYALGKASPYTQTVSMNDSNVRSLAGVGGSGTQWSMSSLYGKSPGFSSVSLAGIPSNSFAYYTSSTTIEISINLYSDGIWDVSDDSGQQATGNWGSPTTSGGGAAYWVKFTRTGVTPVGSGNSTPTTGWLNLSTTRSVSDYVNFFDTQAQSAQYTIQIATDSGGSNIIATVTGRQITAVPGTPP